MDSGIFTTVASTYADVFSGYFTQFMGWGKMLFSGLLILNMGWLFLWYAFDKESIAQGMSAFLKRFFVIMLFYTIMVNPDWLRSILASSQSMGILLTGIPIDPSSILSEGVSIANKLMLPIEKSSLLSVGIGAILAIISYVVVLFAFISISLMLAVTLITATAMISVCCFFLGFAALGATPQISRQSLDVLLGLCVKLLGLYMVIGAGSTTMTSIANSIPTSLISFDSYAYIISAVLLFWLIAKNLPEQLAKIVGGAVQETRGTDAAAIAMAAVRIAHQLNPKMKAAELLMKASGATVAAAAFKATGAVAKNAAAHFANAGSTNSLATKTGSALVGSAADFGKAGLGTVSDHFKNIASKMSGGSGAAGGVSSVSDRLNQASTLLKSSGSTSIFHAGGGVNDANNRPSSSADKAASSSGRSTTISQTNGQGIGSGADQGVGSNKEKGDSSITSSLIENTSKGQGIGSGIDYGRKRDLVSPSKKDSKK